MAYHVHFYSEQFYVPTIQWSTAAGCVEVLDKDHYDINCLSISEAGIPCCCFVESYATGSTGTVY